MTHQVSSRQAAKMIAASFFLTLCGWVAPAFGQSEPAPRDSQQDEGPLKIGTNLVTAGVIVTDRYGRFITGLNRGDFAVREDGKLHKIENFSSTEAAFNVALLIDTSRSTQNKLGAIRKAAQSFIKLLQPRDRVMIVSFDEKINFVTDFTSNRAELDRAVKSLKSSYLTRLYDAIHLTVNEKMKNLPGRKAIVVLTDGVDRSSKLASFESALELVSNAGIISYTIQYETRNDGGPINRPLFLPRFGNSFVGGAVRRWQEPQDKPAEEPKPLINLPRPTTSILSAPPGSQPSSRVNQQASQSLRDPYLVAFEFLRALAVQSGALHLRAESIESTTYQFQIIAEELRNQYTLTYISTNEQRDGNYRTIAVGVRNPDLVVRTRLGYRAAKADPADAEKSGKP
jgi:VWFA-related protein